MDNKESLIAARRSWNLLLFLIPQAARNMLEALRMARAAVWNDSTAEEKALFAQQEAAFGKVYKAVGAMSRNEWGSADEQLSDLIAEFEKLKPVPDREAEELLGKDFGNNPDGLTVTVDAAKMRAQRLARALSGQ